MNKIFYISEAKQKYGFLWPVILPRSSGKTLAILNSMKHNDICISPYHNTKSMFKSILKKEGYIYQDTRNYLLSPRGEVWLSTNMAPLELFVSSKLYGTIFVDDFLYYENDKIEIFIRKILQVANNAIIISSNYHDRDIPDILKGKNIYYNKIRPLKENVINLPEELFVL